MRALPDCLSRFEVPQKAVIYSGWLRIPELLVFVVLLSIFVLYNWLYQLGFVKVVTLRARCMPQLTQLSDNWDTCSPFHNTCNYTQPDVEQLDWCKQSGSKAYLTNCKVFTDPTRAAGPVSENSLFVGSSVFNYGQENNLNEFYSIANFGQFLMKFACGFYHDHVGRLFLTSGTGFMQFAGEAEPRVIPDRYGDDSSLSVPEWTAKFKKVSTAPLVGSSYSNATCFSQKDADYYGIELLLRAANVSINEHASRLRGIGIRMHVRFTNVDVKDFWSSPIGFKNKYIITPTQLRLSELAADPDQEFWIEHAPMDSAAATKIKGVYFAIEAEGSFGNFWPFYAASKFAVATLFLGVGKMISSRVLTEIYKRTASLQHVSVLHQLGEYEEHEDEESNRIHSLLQEGHPMHKISKSPNVRSLRESHRALF